MNLNVDLTEKGQGTVLPIDMMKQSVRNASYLAFFDSCICRTNKGCKDYSVDFGCIFLGEGARAGEERCRSSDFRFRGRGED